MGYFVKTTFWLGLVYSAMPLGEAPDIYAPAAAAAAPAALCAVASEALAAKIGPSAAPYRDAATKSCAAFAAAEAQAALQRAAKAPPTAASADTLVNADKLPPWLPPLRPTPQSKSS